jgi:hypothetical protein
MPWHRTVSRRAPAGHTLILALIHRAYQLFFRRMGLKCTQTRRGMILGMDSWA